MPIGIALIRGINVGGKNPLPMADLRGMCEQLGLRDAQTYIQSGNVVFKADKRGLARAAAELEAAIERKHGFRPSVVVRGLNQLQAVRRANPFAAVARDEPGKLLVMFLAEAPDASAAKKLAALDGYPEKLVARGADAYIHFPNGAGKAKLTMAMIERALGVPGTCRNWNTVETLVEMGEATDGAGRV